MSYLRIDKVNIWLNIECLSNIFKLILKFILIILMTIFLSLLAYVLVVLVIGLGLILSPIIILALGCTS